MPPSTSRERFIHSERVLTLLLTAFATGFAALIAWLGPVRRPLDLLTGLDKRRFSELVLQDVLPRKTPAGVIMFNINRFTRRDRHFAQQPVPRHTRLRHRDDQPRSTE